MPSVSEDDFEIIETTLTAWPEAFGALVEKYQERLYNSLARLWGSRIDVEAVVQETFVKAFKKLDTFRGTSSFYTWLYRIAYNTAVSSHRRTPPTISLDAIQEATGDQLTDSCGRPDEALEKKDQARQVQKALQALSDEHRAILILREVEDMSYENIGELLGTPVGTIRSRLHRARICFKEELSRVMRKDLE